MTRFIIETGLLSLIRKFKTIIRYVKMYLYIPIISHLYSKILVTNTYSVCWTKYGGKATWFRIFWEMHHEERNTRKMYLFVLISIQVESEQPQRSEAGLWERQRGKLLNAGPQAPQSDWDRRIIFAFRTERKLDAKEVVREETKCRKCHRNRSTDRNL